MLMLLKLFIVLFSCAITIAFASCTLLFGANCGEPALDVLLVRPSNLAAMWPLPPPFMAASICEGDVVLTMPSGMGGGGGNASRLVDMLRPRVGVLALEAVGVPPLLPLDGGAGGGWEGRGLVRDGVPGA